MEKAPAKVHDKNFLKSLELISLNIIVFDRSYNYYHQFALWTKQQVYFVTWLKKNAVYRVVANNTKKVANGSNMVYIYTKNRKLCQDKVYLSRNQMMSG